MSKPEPEDEAPIVYAVGMARTSKGWTAYELQIQGNRVLSRELLDDYPQPRASAMERLKIRAAQRFLLSDLSRGGLA